MSVTDAAVTGRGPDDPEFDRLMALLGHDLPDDLRTGVLAVHVELRRMTSLLRAVDLPPQAEPAHVFTVEIPVTEA